MRIAQICGCWLPDEETRAVGKLQCNRVGKETAYQHVLGLKCGHSCSFLNRATCPSPPKKVVAGDRTVSHG